MWVGFNGGGVGNDALAFDSPVVNLKASNHRQAEYFIS